MYKRKLQALKHHSPEKFNVKDEAHFRSTVVWLEDQHIRHYKVEDRESLRNIKSSVWPSHFKKYLEDLECPFADTETAEVMDWLLGWAVHTEYAEKKSLYQEKTAENVAKIDHTQAPRVVTDNPLDNLSFDSDDFKAGVASLAALLNVTKHPDHLVTLKALGNLIKERITEDAVKNPNNYIIEGTPFPLQECDLGFDTGDYVLNQACKVLRLLFVRDLRDLQSRINEAIVGVQAITANPKTDSSLGKVGIK